MNKQDDLPESDSVFDFLYQDVRRVGSYLAQLTPSGHVQIVKQTIATEEMGALGGKVSAGASALVARAGGDFSTQTGNTNKDSLERTFDPLWRNAIELLDLLEDQNLIRRNVSTANIGEFVVVTGTLGVFDPSLLKIIWGIPELRAAVEQSVATIIAAPADNKKNKPSLSKTIVKVIMALPETIQVRVRDAYGHMIYCNIHENGLISTTTELFLKHGIAVPGEWAVLGIMDAHPGPWLSDDPKIAQDLGLSDTGVFPALLNVIQGLMREAGRPAIAYGLTPLLIFRKAG